MMNTHAGKSHDDKVAVRQEKKQKAHEQSGGDMAVPGSESDKQHSSGELSDEGKQVWRKGAGIDGGGKV
jgi:hypothetical protein